MPFEKKSNHPENIAFIKQLKTLKDSDIDDMVHGIAHEETSKTDCTTCGNCCKSLHPALSENDMINIAKHLDLDVIAVTNKYSEYDVQKKMYYMKSSPCSFLKDNRCDIYTNRPLSCHDYPHLHQKHFKYRINQVMFNYNICPIVYNTVERVKKAMLNFE